MTDSRNRTLGFSLEMGKTAVAQAASSTSRKKKIQFGIRKESFNLENDILSHVIKSNYVEVHD